MTRAWRGSFGVLLMSAATSVALSRLITHGLRPGVIVPMILAIVVADQGAALVMRIRIPMVPAIAIGAALSFLSLLVGFDPTLINPASPPFADLSYASTQFHAARAALANDGTPLPPLTGVLIAIGALGALGAAATRSIWESQARREPLKVGHIGPLTGCIAPSFGIFVYSTLVSADHGRVPAALAYFAGTGLFVALSDRSGVDVRSWRARNLPIGAVISSALVLAVVLLAGTGLSGMHLSVFHVTPPAANGQHGGGKGPTSGGPQLLTGTALVDDIRAVEISESNTEIFQAHSTVPTYWQVGTLTSFDGTEWLPSAGVQAALAGTANANASNLGPSPLPVPSNGRTFGASVDISAFASRLLPSPPHTVSVHGLPGATTVGQEGVLAPTSSKSGTTYSVTAQLPPTQPSSVAQLALNDPRLAPYLALPAEPEIVSFLAHEAVGSATTQGAEVQTLVNWFRSGRFRYTLNPPQTSGSDPLVQFLTVTRAGYCQQFAGAFGIMARSLGIPTRLVVGFIAGQSGPDGSYTVTGADAHVWPQVYLGPGTGWVSVEPTPPATGDTTTPAGVVGPNAPPATTGTTQVPAGGHGSGTTVPTGSSSGASHKSSGAAHGGSGFPWWLIVVLLAVSVAAAIVWTRRGSGRDDRALAPDHRIVRAWERTQRSLRHRGLGRRAAETPGEYAARLGRLEHRSDRRIGADALGRLAALVDLACYSPGPCTSADADQAQGWAMSVITLNGRASRFSARRPLRPNPS